MDPNQFLDDLAVSLDKNDLKQVEGLVDRLDPTGFQDKQIKKTLGLIRRKRRFAELEKASSIFVASGNQAPLIRRQWAQALLDQGRVDQSLAVLRVIDSQITERDPEKPEVRGLIGRAHKQMYVNQGGKENLHRAVDAYRKGWKARQGDYRWHGINLVALLKRAERDQISPRANEKPDSIAVEILGEINDLDEPQIWDYGTAMEASLALGDKPGSLKWAKAYVRHPRADAFELGSTLRQLREVWQVDHTDIGKALVPVIEYELLQREGGFVSDPTFRVEDSIGFEAIYGPESYVRVEWIENLARSLESVARVFHCRTGESFGTGFLVKGSELNTDWGDETVFVTNSHVVSDLKKDEAPLLPEDACAEFTRLPGRPRFPLGAKRFHSERTDLDVWICNMGAFQDGASLDLSFYPPLVAEEGDRPQRVFVVGHPKGGELVVSLFNNDLVGYQDQYAHYRSPTEGGSSGSPVLARDLKAFALHHRTREELEVNEGIVFEYIKDRISTTT